MNRFVKNSLALAAIALLVPALPLSRACAGDTAETAREERDPGTWYGGDATMIFDAVGVRTEKEEAFHRSIVHPSGKAAAKETPKVWGDNPSPYATMGSPGDVRRGEDGYNR